MNIIKNLIFTDIRDLLRMIFLILILGLSACSDGNGSGIQSNGIYSQTPIGDYELLFIGNSHSSVNNIPSLVAILLEANMPEKTAHAHAVPSWGFLIDHLVNFNTQLILESREWTHVFLQAQKYSSTGRYSYPTDSAEEWIRRVRSANAEPILFPEWPRNGNTEEGQRVYELHLYISSQEPACVAPVGPVWDEFIVQYPSVVLHAPDGNHSSVNGALLTAYIFYQLITSNSAADLSYVSSINVSAAMQQQLREIAARVTEELGTCEL